MKCLSEKIRFSLWPKLWYMLDRWLLRLGSSKKKTAAMLKAFNIGQLNNQICCIVHYYYRLPSAGLQSSPSKRLTFAETAICFGTFSSAAFPLLSL